VFVLEPRVDPVVVLETVIVRVDVDEDVCVLEGIDDNEF